MIIDIINSPAKQHHAGWYYEGCKCPIGSPPCSWCMSLTEKEVELLDGESYESVLKYRRRSKDE